MNRKIFALVMTVVLSLSFSGQVLAEGNFKYKSPNYSIIDGTVRELTDTAVAVDIKDAGNKEVKYLWFFDQDIEKNVQIGDNLKVFYKGTVVEEPIFDINKPLRVYYYYNTDEEISDEFKLMFIDRRNLKEKANVTRGSMAEIMASYHTIDYDDKSRKPYVEEAIFSDVVGSTWEMEINYAFSQGIISNSEDGKFRPQEYIKYEDVIVMILNSNMNDKLKEEISLEGAYPKGYMTCASKYIGADDERLGTYVNKMDVVNLLFATYNLDAK